MTDRCEHFEGIRPVDPRTAGCEGCEPLGATEWIALRVCLTCGHVGCCEDSKHAHALAHHLATGHPVIASIERGDTWAWCYPHRRYFDPAPVPVPKPRSALRAFFARLSRKA